MKMALNNATHGNISKLDRQRPVKLGILLRKWGSLGFFVIMISCFSLATDHYLTVSNISNMIYESIVPIVISIGLTIVIIVGSFDLSIGAIASFGGMIAAMLFTQVGIIAACLIGLGAGSALGLFNGILIGILGFSGIIITLGMQFIITAVEYWISGGFETSISMDFEGFITFGQGNIGPIKIMIGALLFLAIVAHILMSKTSLGVKIWATGDNPLAAVYSGLRINFFVTLAFILSGAFSSLAGIMMVAMNATHMPTVGQGYLLDAFTIVYLGSTFLREGKPHVLGTVMAGIMVSCLITGMVMMGIPYEWKILIKGVVLIAAVAVSFFLRHEDVHTQFI
jgi:ribose transport system permease protein